MDCAQVNDLRYHCVVLQHRGGRRRNDANVHVLRNYVSLFDGDVNGSGSVQNYSTGSRGVALNAGDVIDLVVGAKR